MRYVTVTTVGLAAVMLVGAPAYARAEDEKPSTTERIEQKADEAGSKVKGMANDVKMTVSDSWVTSKTKIALFADERVKVHQINVETKNGMVMLRGKVDSEAAKAAASDVTKRIEHVKGVRNELQVVPPGDRPRVDTDDKAILTMVDQRLKEDRLLKTAKINARVDSGIVTLTGEVKSLAVCSWASEVLSDVPGVRAVRNDLSYAPRSSSLSPSGGN